MANLSPGVAGISLGFHVEFQSWVPNVHLWGWGGGMGTENQNGIKYVSREKGAL